MAVGVLAERAQRRDLRAERAVVSGGATDLGGEAAQLALAERQVQPIEVRAGTFATNQRPHRKAGIDQAARDGRADEPARPGHENLVLVAHAGVPVGQRAGIDLP